MQQLSQTRLCLVEDDAIMGESLVDRFVMEGFSVDWWQRKQDAAEAFQKKTYDLVISDVCLPDGTGDELFTDIADQRSRVPPFVFITGFGSVEAAVQLLKMGAGDYVTKPFDLDKLVDKARALCVDRRSATRLETKQAWNLGVSQAMQAIEHIISRVADYSVPILIIGDSGVGKEFVAKHIHSAKGSMDHPFVAINCAALTETLLESELFGHERGAFTGACRAKRGVFERAHGGTLFLDEIGDMPLSMQAKLLRVIQDNQVTPVGGETSIRVKFQLVCATNKDIKKMISEGSFREDLYYRINVVELNVPRLAERTDDIHWFAQKFLEELAHRFGPERKTLSPAAEHALLEYSWPGNVRELRHLLERAWILSDDAVLRAYDLFPQQSPATEIGDSGGLDVYLSICERAYITRALALSTGHIGQTAAYLGISRKNLWEKMKKLAIVAKG